MNDPQAIWESCVQTIRPQVSDAVWQNTFRTTTPRSLDGQTLVLGVPNSIVKDRLEGAYLSLIQDALTEAGHRELSLRIEHEPEVAYAPVQPALVANMSGTSDAETPDRASTPPPAREGWTEQINAAYTFDLFVTGASNRFAHAAALSVAETPARSYNPLFIYGDAGLGKTHLLHAIAHYVASNYPNLEVRYVSTETFLNEFVDAIRTNDRTAFKRRYREVDVLLVDDIQFMEGKEGLQEEFFYTFNSLHQANKQVVLSSDRSPDNISTLEDRLRSRFKMGLITDIQPPDLETRLAILQKKADQNGIAVPDDVLEFIATNITDNIRELEGALIRVTAYASVYQEELTVELAGKLLWDSLVTKPPRRITPTIILNETSSMFDIPIEDIIGPRRYRALVNARQIAMYVCRHMTDLSFPGIAKVFGDRDHTTVIHAVEKIGVQMAERLDTYDQVTELMQIIRTGER